MRKHGGFTLVELLVVIAIIGILVSLLLPAVQAARAAARWMQCRNNLKQLGLALHNYHNVHKAFPPAHLESGATGPTFRHQLGWLTNLLPYVEQENVYELIDFGQIDPSRSASQNPAFMAAGGTDIAVFICPSDPVRRRNTDWAPTNYLANQGTNCSCRGPSCNGVFGHNTFTRFAHITDGTSTTIAIGETLKGDFDPNTLGDNYIRTRDANAQDIDSCQGSLPNASDRAMVWLGGHPQNNMFSTNRVPNDPRFDCKAPHNGCVNFAARSAHAGGAQFGMCDGSVHFVADAVDVTVFRALGTRNGTDTVGDF